MKKIESKIKTKTPKKHLPKVVEKKINFSDRETTKRERCGREIDSCGGEKKEKEK